MFRMKFVGVAALVLVTLAPNAAQAQEPNYGAAVSVDGDPADWNQVEDLFAPLYLAGVPDSNWPGYAVLAHSFLRYDCDAQLLSILVLDESGDDRLPVADAAQAWFKVFGQGWADDLLVDGAGAGNTSPRQFAWVHQSAGDPQSPVIGYEASAQLTEAALSSIEASLGYAEIPASTGKHVTGFDHDSFEAGLAAVNELGSTKIRVHFPVAGGPAYFPSTEIDLDGNGTAELDIPSWCIDTDHTINQNTWYCTDMISSYNYPDGLDDTRWENLDVINWILNQGFVGQSSGVHGTYTYGDVQLAIWSLIDDSSAPNSLGAYSPDRVNQILATAAMTVGLDDPAVGYEPSCDGVVGLILLPTNCGSTTAQFLVAQLLVSELPVLCESYDTALALECAPIVVGHDGRTEAFALAPAQPNPFNPVTNLSVTLAETGPASLKVYDMGGREVATLFDGMLAAGTRSIQFQAGGLPSGVYIAVLQSAGGVQSQKLLLLK
ncbi:MAG: T9SS type A sorting domain-containing protein [Candidatus Delongbacteria bacterium]